jgi:5-methylcytosine-specific restriction endonuclease McrA
VSVRPQRAKAMLAACPKCGAPIGQPCVASWGARKAMHRERHSASKGMRLRAPPSPPDFYNSDAWRTLRYRALKQHGGKCQCCGRKGRLHVDHIKPRSRFPELELELTNLQVLCEDCNLGKGAWDQTDWRAAV